MLLGEYESKLTDKNRLAVPKKFREDLGEGLIVSKGYEGCLILLDKLKWLELEKMLNKQPILSLSLRDTKRFLFGSAYEIELDSQGRFVMPENLQKYSDIKEQALFIGITDWVEIWSSERWQLKQIELEKDASDIAEKLFTR